MRKAPGSPRQDSENIVEPSLRSYGRARVEDVACQAVAANLVPHHSTIAGFLVRHEAVLDELFTGLLGAVGGRGDVVGVVAIDWKKVAGAPRARPSRGQERIAREILADVAETDRLLADPRS